jgi:hypothetical protein
MGFMLSTQNSTPQLFEGAQFIDFVMSDPLAGIVASLNVLGQNSVSEIRVTASATFTIINIAAAPDGKTLRIRNISTFDGILAVSGNISGASDITLTAGTFVDMVFSSVSNEWNTSGGVGGGSSEVSVETPITGDGSPGDPIGIDQTLIEINQGQVTNLIVDLTDIAGIANTAQGTANTALAAAAASVQPARLISTTAPLSGGGDLSANRTLTTSMATNRLVGRATANVGVMEEIQLGVGLSVSGGTLNRTMDGARAARTTTNFNLTNGSSVPMQWNSETFDTAAYWSAAANTRFIAPRNGYYLVLATVFLSINGVAVYDAGALYFRLNGGTDQYSEVLQVAAVEDMGLTTQNVFLLNATDYVEAMVYGGGTGTLQVVGTGNNTQSSNMCMIWLGG